MSVEQALAGLYTATDRLRGIGRGGLPDASAVPVARAYVAGLAEVADRLHPAQRAAFHRAALRLLDALTPLTPAAMRSDWLANRNLVAARVDTMATEAKAETPLQVEIVAMPERTRRAVRDRQGQLQGTVETDGD